MQLYEKDFEDWICANLPAVVGHDDAKLVGRQIPLPGGRVLDVLAGFQRHPEEGDPLKPFELVVIEVKRDAVTPEAVLQVMGYMSDVVAATAGPIMKACSNALGSQRVDVNIRRVRGIVAAPSIDREAARILEASNDVNYVKIGVRLYASRAANILETRIGEACESQAVLDALNRTFLPPIVVLYDANR